MKQEITFLTDGGDTVPNLAADMSLCAEHVLDWFHLTMRLTVLRQYAKGLAHDDEEEAHAAERELRRIKGYLWNGNHRDALTCIDGLVDDLEGLTADQEMPCFVEVGSIKIRGVKVVDFDARTIPDRRYRMPSRLSDGGWSRRLTPRILMLPMTAAQAGGGAPLLRGTCDI